MRLADVPPPGQAHEKDNGSAERNERNGYHKNDNDGTGKVELAIGKENLLYLVELPDGQAGGRAGGLAPGNGIASFLRPDWEMTRRAAFLGGAFSTKLSFCQEVVND